jgi:hypothetical protein
MNMQFTKQDIEKQRISLMKESMKERIRNRINESRPKNIANVDQVMKLKGRRPKSIKARINQIYTLIKTYGIDNKRYQGEDWSEALNSYAKVIESLGGQCEFKCNGDGYTDYDNYDNMPRTKEYQVIITFEDGMEITGVLKCMACGTLSNPFKEYDTVLLLNNKLKHELTAESIRNTVSSTIKRYLNEEEGDEYVVDAKDDIYDSDEGDEEDDAFEAYKNDYKGENFDPNSISEDELADFCENNDFLYLYRPFGRWKISVANSSEIADDIINDIYSCAYFEPTHDMDIYIENKEDLFKNSNHVVVFRLNHTKDGDYYIIYQD